MGGSQFPEGTSFTVLRRESTKEVGSGRRLSVTDNHLSWRKKERDVLV